MAVLKNVRDHWKAVCQTSSIVWRTREWVAPRRGGDIMSSIQALISSGRGVEPGIVLAQPIVPELESQAEPKRTHDSSTNNLFERCRSSRQRN
jgi:hypothetical protein